MTLPVISAVRMDLFQTKKLIETGTVDLASTSKLSDSAPHLTERYIDYYLYVCVCVCNK